MEIETLAAIVTGGASGLGAATARAFAAAEARAAAAHGPHRRARRPGLA